MSVCHDSENMLTSSASASTSTSSSTSTPLLDETNTVSQPPQSPQQGLPIQQPLVVTTYASNLTQNVETVRIGEKVESASPLQTAKGGIATTKLVVTNHPTIGCGSLVQKSLNPPLITVLNPSGPLTVVKTLCVTSGVPCAPQFTLVNSTPLTVTNAAVKSPTITLLSAPMTVVKAIGASAQQPVEKNPIEVAPSVSTVVENRGHNVFVKNSYLDANVSDVTPQSHKLLTANNFPPPNTSNTPTQPKTLNGQKGKVKIVSNVVIPGTSQINNSNVLLNKTNQQQRYAPGRQKVVGPNGAAPRYLNKPPPTLGAVNNHGQDKQSTRAAVHKSHIKTIPPMGGGGGGGSGQQRVPPHGIKTLSPRTGAGLRTIPPQRPNKANYIGKHAVQAQKTRQVHKVKPVKVGTAATGGGGGGAQGVRVPPTKTTQLPTTDNPVTDMTFNQALTAQIIETLSSNTAPPVPSNRYEVLPTRYESAFACPDAKPNPKPIIELIKPGEDKNKSGLDALSLICQAVLLDHNYNATLPPDSPTRPPQMNLLSPPINGGSTPTMYSPGTAKRRSLPQPCPTSSTSHHHHHPAAPPPPSQPSSVNPLMAFRGGGAGVGNDNDDDAASDVSDVSERKHDTEGEETDTAPEAEAVNNENFEGYGDYVTRCICTFVHDDGYMVECDKCKVWQHVQCVVKNRQVPDEYLCEVCDPSKVIDRQKARTLQQQWLKERQSIDPKLRKDPKIKEIFKPKESVSDTDSTDGGEHASPNENVKARSVSNRRKNDNSQKQAVRQRREAAKEAVQRRQKRKERKIVRKKPKPVAKPASEDEQAADGWAAHLPQLRQWIEKYEEAVTNHYSPELRARISSIRVNGTHSETDVQFDVSVNKCRVYTKPLTEIKYLVSTTYLEPNAPVVELRGKYMLSAQHRNSGGSLTTRQHSQRPGPFLFFYRLVKDNTEVCVDTRTYGNSARFIRRSCRPNAELRHCIEKGALHIYIVTLHSVEKNGELTIKHESHDLAAIGTTTIACACGQPNECHVNKSPTVKKNGDSSETTSKKRRGRRTASLCQPETDSSKSASETLLSPVSASLIVPAPVIQSPVKVKQEKLEVTEKAEVVEQKLKPDSVKAEVDEVKVEIKPESFLEAKLEENYRPSSDVKEEHGKQGEEGDDEDEDVDRTRSNSVSTRRGSQYKSDKDDDKHGDSVKETKKGDNKKKPSREDRKLEAILRAIDQMERAESRKQHQAKHAHRRESEPGPGGVSKDEDKQDTKFKRRRRKGRARTVSQSTRRNRLNSTDSYMTSGDENILSPNDNILCNKSSPRDLSADHSDNRAVGLLLSLSNGDNGTVNKEQKSPSRDVDSNSNSAHSSPETQLSSACLLVQAAVEPLEQGFKFPKTKKGLMNEWLNKVSEPVPTASSISPSFMSPHSTNNLEEVMFTPTKSTSLTQMPSSYDANVQPRGNAKKRWLRQAISEDHSSDRPDSPPLSDMVAPPKKRRLPRESLSAETSPPNTPTSTVPPSNSSINETLNPEGCVEIVYNACAEGDSPTQVLESDAVLKERAAKMKQEFAGSLGGPLSCMDPRLSSRDSQMFTNTDLVGTVEKTLTMLGFESSTQIATSSKPSQQPKRKVKLSISEYRQRKKLNTNDKNEEVEQEAETNIAEDNNSSESFRASARARSVSSSSSSTSLTSSDDEAIPLEIPVKAPAFNSEPTELERQRELASLRLKKVLGLNVEEARPASIMESIANMEMEPKAKPIALPFPSPTFPIPGAAEIQTTDEDIPKVVATEEQPVELPSELPDPEATKIDIEKLDASEDVSTVVETKAIEVESELYVSSPQQSDEEPTVPIDPEFEEAETLSYVPPFNNPVYPNDNFTNFTSTIDDDLRYEGRNPSPPPNLEKAESSSES